MKAIMVRRMGVCSVTLLLTCVLWSCTDEPGTGVEGVDPDASLPSETEAADQESAAEQAASEITEENADAILEELERALEDAEKASAQGDG